MSTSSVVSSKPTTMALDATDLQTINVFQNAASVTLARLSIMCSRRRFRPGDHVFSQGTHQGQVMLLLSGTVRVGVVSKEGREIVFRRIGPGEVFGDYAAIDHRERSADIVAVTEIDVAVLSAKDFVHLVAADPAVALAEMQRLVESIRILSDRVLSMSSRKANERLAALLLELVGSDAKDHALIQDLPTHSELAAMISSQRHVVTTELGKLEKNEIIHRRGHDLELRDLQALKDLAAGL